VLQLWKDRTCGRRLPVPGKQTRGCPDPSSRGHPQRPVSAHTVMHTPCTNTHVRIVPTLTHNTNRVAHIRDMVNNRNTLMLLHSGASCSVISRPHATHAHVAPVHTTRLVNADGRDIAPCGVAAMTISPGKFSTAHTFVVVDHLSTPVILGCDFLMNHGYVLDFKRCTFHRAQTPEDVLQLLPTRTTQPPHTITMNDECPEAIPTPCKHQLSHTRHAHRHTRCSQIRAKRTQVPVLTRTRLHKHYTTHH